MPSRPVEVLVSNAGLQHVAPLEEFPIAKWILLVQVMLVGVARLTRAVLPGMRERRLPAASSASVRSIRLVASPYTERLRRRCHTACSVSKVVALETAGADITINTICPTCVKTPLVDRTDRRPGAAQHPGGAGGERGDAEADAEGVFITFEELAEHRRVP